jgi:hypothetical protein
VTFLSSFWKDRRISSVKSVYSTFAQPASLALSTDCCGVCQSLTMYADANALSSSADTNGPSPRKRSETTMKPPPLVTRSASLSACDLLYA